jgi:hypothetical protein
MLILDLQSKKKAILKQILDVRQELVMLDKREMAVIERASHVEASDGERADGALGLPSNLPEFSPAVRTEYVPGTSAEEMYENQKKYNDGLGALKDSQTHQLDEIHALKSRLDAEAAALERDGQSGGGSGMHLIDSPMQSAIYTVQEMVGELGQDEGEENQQVAHALMGVLSTLTASNAYMPAFDFSKTRSDVGESTKSWLKSNFSTAAGEDVAEPDAPLVGGDGEAAAVCGLEAEEIEGLDTLAFSCWVLPMERYERVILYMFKTTGLLERFQVTDDLCRRFITAAHKGYRNNPYHNWRHAFDVSQMAFCITRQTTLGQTLKPLEMYALMLTALCHDIDHGGKTNDFLVDTGSPIALLYNLKSVNENHHCTYTFKMLSEEGTNMLNALSLEQKKAVRKMMIACFKATDMTFHFEIVNQFKSKLKDQGGFVPESPEDTQLMLNLMMHASDLSNPVRDYENAKQWASAVNEEWWLQGDMEQRMGLPVGGMNKRPDAAGTEQQIAGTQLGFGDFVVGPMYESLAQGMDGPAGLFQKCVDTLAENRAKYVVVKDGGAGL